ncbi:sodium-independent organic anion transporter [Loa loa]|uniref:Solute carrier organic anion transporter family member n=2 Tax=Loa loa TaxID=7209 RepID=A0A1S0UGQ5_LOALO|nr:sodium-independent organic anion transporter [Loa loa]EJD74004.1 sodium-independent organic anion transporter [Loa loa]
MSGLMVSAGDFGYIPSVVFVSYFGSKGNRARWIGAGTLMIAFANILISMSNFLFPVQITQLNSTFIESNLISDRNYLDDNIKSNTFLNYAKTFSDAKSFPLEQTLKMHALNATLRQFADEKLSSCNHYQNNSNQLCAIFFSFMQQLNQPNVTEISNLRILIGSPFSFCNTMFNTLRREMNKIRCSNELSNLGPFIMIFAGLLILGIGRTMPYSLGLPLIDDNVKRQNLPLYFAGMFFIRILGPFLGFLIGSIVNNYYYSFDVPAGLTSRDPSWIGRWWAGFLGIGIAMLCPSLALYLYPTCINYNPNDMEKEHYSVAKNNLDDHTTSEIHSLVNERYVVEKKMRNKNLALIDRHATRNETGDTVMPTSTKAQITAIQFGLPQNKINLFLGLISLPGLAVGLLIGGVIMRKFKLQGRKAVAYILICSSIAALFSLQNAMIGCKSVLSLIGDKAKLINRNFTTTCNNDCNCIGMPLYPVCNQEGEAFYSPCHAGCSLDQTFSNPSINKIFQNCSCSNSTNNNVSRDFCDQSICEQKFAWYFLNLAFSGIFGGMSIIPSVLIVLRSVPPMDRSISLGFQGFFVSLIATLPSSVFWGWIIDKTCIMWNTVCGKGLRGACELYDTDKLRLMTHLTYGAIRLVSAIPDIAVFYFAKDLLLTDHERNG